MDFEFTKEEETFGEEVHEFMEKEYPPEWRGRVRGFFEALHAGDEEWEFIRAMARKLGTKGWLSLAWPEKYGGRGSPFLQLVLTEELGYSGCPGWDLFGVGMLAPTIINFGSEEQKERFLPGIAKGETFWCECLSEPNTGSDLASLQTRAVEKQDHFLINGQKVWTSQAHRADWVMVLARTDPSQPKHKGLSFFLVDMKTPGITVNPIINMAGHHELNEVFFDDVKVPKENILGGLNQGWQVVMALLDFERSCIPVFAIARRNLDDILDYTRERKSLDPVLRKQLAELMVECEVGRLIHYRVVWMQSKGITSNYESAMNKVYALELAQRVLLAGMRVLGSCSGLLPGSRWAPLDGQLALRYLRSIGHTLEMGTSEIDRDIIGLRGLGLPRG